MCAFGRKKQSKNKLSVQLRVTKKKFEGRVTNFYQ